MNYFRDDEMVCRCGCGRNNINQELVDRLNIARGEAGRPFVINSACRCPRHNKAEGGSPTSSHLTGLAVDIKVSGGQEKFAVLTALLKAGFKRVGIANSFIHCDIDNNKTQNTIWTY